MKRILILPKSLLWFLAVSTLSLLSCSNNENDDIKPDSNGECVITLNISEALDNTDARSYLPEATKVSQQKINDELILETEVIRENASNSRATETQLYPSTRVLAIIYKKGESEELVVYKAQELIVQRGQVNRLIVPNQDIIIDFYSLNAYRFFSQPEEGVMWKPEVGTPRKDVKYTINLDSDFQNSDHDFLYESIECTYPFDDLNKVVLKHPFPQIAIRMISQEAGVVSSFDAGLISNSSYQKATICIKDGNVTDRDGDQAITFYAINGDNGGVISYDEKNANAPYGLGNRQSLYSIVIPKNSTTTHKVRINSLLIEGKEVLQAPIIVDLDNTKLPLNAGTRYIIKFTIKRPALPEADVPYVQFKNIQVAKANLQYGHGKWFVGDDPTYKSLENTNGGDDHFAWNTIYSYNWTTFYIPTEWKDSNDPCTKLGSTWHTPTRTEWAQLIGNYEGLSFDNHPSKSVYGLFIKEDDKEIFLPLNGYTMAGNNGIYPVTTYEYNNTSFYRLSNPEGELNDGQTYAFRVGRYPDKIGSVYGEIGDMCYETLRKKEEGNAVRCVRSIPAP